MQVVAINLIFLYNLLLFLLFFSCLLYFLNPLILATYTFIIAIISLTISSSCSNLSGSLIIIIFPFEYLVIISSINSKSNLVNLSLWLLLIHLLFLLLLNELFFIPLLFKFNPEPISSIIKCFGYFCTLIVFVFLDHLFGLVKKDENFLIIFTAGLF
jgi:hypothetical protein